MASRTQLVPYVGQDVRFNATRMEQILLEIGEFPSSEGRLRLPYIHSCYTQISCMKIEILCELTNFCLVDLF